MFGFGSKKSTVTPEAQAYYDKCDRELDEVFVQAGFPSKFAPLMTPPPVPSNVDAGAIVVSKDGFYQPVKVVVVDAMSVETMVHATQNGCDIILCGRRYTPAAER